MANPWLPPRPFTFFLPNFARAMVSKETPDDVHAQWLTIPYIPPYAACIPPCAACMPPHTAYTPPVTQVCLMTHKVCPSDQHRPLQQAPCLLPSQSILCVVIHKQLPTTLDARCDLQPNLLAIWVDHKFCIGVVSACIHQGGHTMPLHRLSQPLNQHPPTLS